MVVLFGKCLYLNPNNFKSNLWVNGYVLRNTVFNSTATPLHKKFKEENTQSWNAEQILYTFGKYNW